MRKTININKLEELEVKELERFTLILLQKLQEVNYLKYEKELSMNEDSKGQFDRFVALAKERYELSVKANNLIKQMPH